MIARHSGPFQCEGESDEAFLTRCNRGLRLEIRALRKELERTQTERDKYKAALGLGGEVETARK